MSTSSLEKFNFGGYNRCGLPAMLFPSKWNLFRNSGPKCGFTDGWDRWQKWKWTEINLLSRINVYKGHTTIHKTKRDVSLNQDITFFRGFLDPQSQVETSAFMWTAHSNLCFKGPTDWATLFQVQRPAGRQSEVHVHKLQADEVIRKYKIRNSLSNLRRDGDSNGESCV